MAQRETEGSYRELFEGNPQAMLVCRRETNRIVAANRAAADLYGYAVEGLVGLDLKELGEEPLPASGEDQAFSARHRKNGGELLEVGVIAHPCEFAGEPARLLLVSRKEKGESQREALLEEQVAERNAQLEAAQRELETFCYSVSHDLRAPLRHIDGFSRAVLDDYSQVLDHQAHEYLARIGQAAGKMSQLLDAMGQLARVARSQLELQKVNLSVNAQVIYLELKHRSPDREVDFRIQEGVGAVADSRLVRQLLEILIGNAWKFTSRVPAAVIQFGATEMNGENVYYVKDNGAGFDMEYADKLFSIFHRQHRADEFEGSGVGLAIAQRIISRHGGRIWAESAPNEGATFYFTLQSRH